MTAINQIENSVLVPRIVGGTLDHPHRVVIVGVMMETSLARLLGAGSGCAGLTTVKLLNVYIWRRFSICRRFRRTLRRVRWRTACLQQACGGACAGG